MTVLRRLREVSIRAYRPCQRSRLLSHHSRARLRWARVHFRWNRIQWRSVVFSDESRFLLERHDGRVRVYRRKGERFHACCIQEAANFGRGSVMVWGAISANHRTSLIRIQGNLTASRYVAEILQPHLLPFMEQHGPWSSCKTTHLLIARVQLKASWTTQVSISWVLGQPIRLTWILSRTCGITSTDMFAHFSIYQQHSISLQHAWVKLRTTSHRLSWEDLCSAWEGVVPCPVVDARGRHTRYWFLFRWASLCLINKF